MRTLALALLLGPVLALAQERPEEAEMFGSTAAPASQPPPPEGLIKKDQEDPLKIGGQVYLRGQAAWYEHQSAGDGPLSTPNLVDLFLEGPGAA